jgi:ATP-dependent protease ClpP protease subunit
MTDVAYFGFTGPIDSSSATRICSALNLAVNQKRGGVYLLFSSLGGYTADGIYLYNHLRAMPIPVTIHALGNVASVAVAVLLGAEHRYCSRHVLFMIHPSVVPGTAEGMSWDRLDNLQRAALAEENRTEGILRDRSRIPKEKLTARRTGDVHFSAEDAVKFGIVDAIEEFSLPLGSEIYQI